MYVKSVTVKNFRNLKNQTVFLGKGLNLFRGLNAQGKTNFLEAVALCALGKSPRCDRDKELINWESEFASVKTDFVSYYGDGKVEIKLTRTEKKRVAINGLPILKIGELLGKINVVYFSPDEIAVIRQGPDARRRFMDIDLCQTDKNYFYTLGRYNRILFQRNNLLKSGGDSLKQMLSIWDGQLADEGAKIFFKRQDFLAKLSPVASKIHEEITDGKEKLLLEFQSELNGKDKNEVKENFLKKLSDGFEKEARLCYTTTGPHRDDIKFSVNGVDIRKFGSQGQQRTAALSLKLAEVNLIAKLSDDPPILLLDDVFGELDGKRRNRLLNYAKGIQTIVTSAEPDIEEIQGEAKVFCVANGKITANN